MGSGMRVLGIGGGGAVKEGVDASDEPELMRFSNQHAFDPFWTDNFPEDQPPSYPKMCLAQCGCGCCLGPCCNEKRRYDWQHLFLTFTVWTAIVEFGMLIIELAIGGVTWPSLGPAAQYYPYDTLTNLGAKDLYLMRCKYQVFRYITPVVLHSGVIHYLLNMSFTYRIMLQREIYWGLARTIAMYVVSGIGGTILSIGFYPLGTSVGASGALCGIFGGFCVDVVRMWMKMSNMFRYQYGMTIVMCIIMMVVIGFVPQLGVDNGAHLGGFLTGIFLGMILLIKKTCVRVVGAVLLTISWAIPSVIIYAVWIPTHDLCSYSL